jgi:polysaccharide export outer membrane protein
MKRTKLLAAALAIFALGVLTASAQQIHAVNESAVTAADRAPEVQTSQPELKQRYPRYVIQRQDVLLLTFPISPELNQTVTVQPDGYVNLQNMESLHVQGLTVPELVVALKKAYTGVLHDPIINVDLVDFQKPFFTVSGQVGKPGQYDLRADITVAEGLAVAGGMTPTAKTQIFLFRRTSKDVFEVRKLNVKDVLRGKNVNEDATLQPGDMIYVPEKFIANFRKYVPYSMNAGTYLSQSSF